VIRTGRGPGDSARRARFPGGRGSAVGLLARGEPAGSAHRDGRAVSQRPWPSGVGLLQWQGCSRRPRKVGSSFGSVCLWLPLWPQSSGIEPIALSRDKPCAPCRPAASSQTGSAMGNSGRSTR